MRIIFLIIFGLCFFPSISISAQTEEDLLSVADIVEKGFETSRVVMMNEGHSGMKRSKRTRIVGRLILPRAHKIGVRHLAVEALTEEIAVAANETGVLPESDHAYLAQEDMRELLQSALDLGWTLLAYEAPLDSVGIFKDEIKNANFRESAQARNLYLHLQKMEANAKMLVWSGNNHHSKSSAEFPNLGEITFMGKAFWDISGIEPFTIDQVVTVDFAGDGKRGVNWIVKFKDALLKSPYHTLGFINEKNDPNAYVISLFNSLEE